MPKIDPVTGCEVMTLPEFFNAEAQYEGKGRTGAEVMEETMTSIHDAFAEDNAHIEADYRDPAKALAILQKLAGEEVRQWFKYEHNRDSEDLARPPYPLEVLAVTHAEHSQTLSDSNGKFTARVRCDDGSIRNVSYEFYYYSGTRLDPPDSDESLVWQ